MALNIHPERFWVDYIMEATSEEQAHKLARELCLEQTVELPGQIDAVKQVEAYTVGKLNQQEESIRLCSHLLIYFSLAD